MIQSSTTTTQSAFRMFMRQIIQREVLLATNETLIFRYSKKPKRQVKCVGFGQKEMLVLF